MVVERNSQIPNERDRFLGCLLGLAIGDALGMPVEGWRREAIASEYGWIDSYLPARDLSGEVLLDAGEITDDTEMMLCHVESLISAGGLVDPDTTGWRFLRLYHSDSRRFMGRTTRESLALADETGDFQAGVGGEHAAGNGVAMRVAPIGLLHSLGRFNAEVFAREILRAGVITHSNPEAINGGLAMAYAVRLLAAQEVPSDVLLDEVASFIDEDEVARKLRSAAVQVRRDGDYERALRNLDQIGTSGYVAESVAAAMYCYASFPDDYRAAVSLAVNAGGDTDTVAAMTGALSGTTVGASGIPEDLVEGLAARAYILVAGPGLYEAAQRRAGQFLRLHHR